MPYHPELDEILTMAQPNFETPSATVMSEAWRTELPELQASNLTLRELHLGDAQALFDQLTTEEVARFISPPPASVKGFERFIRWAQSERAAGRDACFVVVPEGRPPRGNVSDPDSRRPRQPPNGASPLGRRMGYRFVHGRRATCRRLCLRTHGHAELEARACVANGRGNGALRKVGAVCEAVLHQSFERRGERLDQGCGRSCARTGCF